MNILVYSDESGVFDRKNEHYFVFGGLILRSKEEKDSASRQFIAIEKVLKCSKKYKTTELKACFVAPKDKRRLFGSLTQCLKFGAVVNLNKINKHIFENKKSKQRYMDYVYKLSVKHALLYYNQIGAINIDNIKNLHIYCDEHSTATDGRYELREAIEHEIKIGTFNSNYNVFFNPIAPGIESITLEYRNSMSTTLIRAADIIANKIYNDVRRGKKDKQDEKIFIHHFP